MSNMNIPILSVFNRFPLTSEFIYTIRASNQHTSSSYQSYLTRPISFLQPKLSHKRNGLHTDHPSNPPNKNSIRQHKTPEEHHNTSKKDPHSKNNGPRPPSKEPPTGGDSSGSLMLLSDDRDHLSKQWPVLEETRPFPVPVRGAAGLRNRLSSRFRYCFFEIRIFGNAPFRVFNNENALERDFVCAFCYFLFMRKLVDFLANFVMWIVKFAFGNGHASYFNMQTCVSSMCGCECDGTG